MNRYASSSSSTLTRCFGTSTSRAAAVTRRKAQPTKTHSKSTPKSNYIPANATIDRRDPPANPEILRTVVSLHHAAASFMPDPSAAGQGFDTAFKDMSQEPRFIRYFTWLRSVLETKSTGKALIPAKNPLADMETEKFAAEKYWSVWEKHDPANDLDLRSTSRTGTLTEREREVREVLLGTWERGGLGMMASRPGLDGVLEYLHAKGITVKDFAREWELRHQTVSEWEQDEVNLIDSPKE